MEKLLKSGIFWTIFTASIGIGLTVAFYEYSKKEREVVYSIKKAPTKIFDSSNLSSNIKLVSNDSIVIEKDVYVSNLVLWNSGQVEIEKRDIRTPISIQKNNIDILEAKIINQTHPEISKFRIIEEADAFKLDWEYFDPDFGLELQVIYSGAEESNISFNGYLLGTEIKMVEARPEIGVVKYFLIVMLFFWLFLVVIIFKDFDKNRWMYYLQQGILLLFIFVACMFLLYKYFVSGYVLPL